MSHMNGSLFDQFGVRKYLVAQERRTFILAAASERDLTSAFYLTLAITGARMSEVLALTPERIDIPNGALVFETLKRRKRSVFRAVPVPPRLLQLLSQLEPVRGQRIWLWCRTKAWSITKQKMIEAGIPNELCKPKALRHAFAVEAGQRGVPLNIIQRWLGHARIETTAIYVGAMGDEERSLTRKTWKTFENSLIISAL